MVKESRDTRKVRARLKKEGWVGRKGKGDHINFKKEGSPHLITLDMGLKEIDKNIYRKIKRQTGWE